MSEPGARVAPNLLDQDFTASRRSGEVDGRYYGHLDLRGMAVPGSRARSVFPAGDRVGHGSDPGRNAD